MITIILFENAAFLGLGQTDSHTGKRIAARKLLSLSLS